MTTRGRRTLIGIIVIAASLSIYAENSAEDQAVAKTVVFVCEHGTVKSVIAMQWFNKLAAERGIETRAVSRGMTPDAAVPPGVATNLAKDGVPLTGFAPKALSKGDLKDAAQVVAIGVDTASVTKGSAVQVDSWNDIPPASENYAASRDALRARIEKLLATLTVAKVKTGR